MRTANYLGLSYQFWTLVVNNVSEMEKMENKSLIITDYVPNQTFEKSY